jgi:photosystem II stability/assembly factor-like uncharacterized protein
MMGERVLILLGTRKGAFILESTDGRKSFSLNGPFCEAGPINHVIGDPESGTIYAGGGNPWFGPVVWKSRDFGETWTRASKGLGYAPGEPAVTSVWSLSPGQDRLYAGVDPAGLFVSEDDGESFEHVAGLRDHPSRPQWNPGAGGLILHSIVRHPDDAEQIWVAISAAGVFHTADGGRTWEPRNRGTRADFNPEDQRYPEFGQCVHCLVMAPGKPNRLYQQNHCGMYRSDDGGRSWESIEEGLPSSFGFPAAVHPRDPDGLFLIPLNGAIEGRFMPDGAAAVWRTGDAGASWEAGRRGLPQENAFFGVLRQALATDALEPSGVYFGTGSGEVYASDDEGKSFRRIAEHLPVISSVETMVLAG